MSVRSAALAVPLFFIVFAFASSSQSAAATLAECQKISANHRPATASDAAVKNGSIKIGDCYNPNEAGIGQTAEQAREYLKRKLTGAAASRGDVSVTKMNGAFACRLADFLRASEASGYDIRIFSGWRDAAAQNNAAANSRPGYACTGGANCPHPQGRAADLVFAGVQIKTTAACNMNPTCRWAHANATRYQLSFPLMGNPLEPWHIEPVERRNVPANGPCGGGGSPAPVANVAPLSGGNMLRQALGMQQQPALPPMPAMPSQPLSQQQSPLSAFNQVPPAQPMQPAPVSGQIGTTPITGGTDGPPSVADQLNAILSGTPTTSFTTSPTAGVATTATSAPIVITGTSSGTIVITTHSSVTPQYGTGSLQPVGQQTFASNDLEQTAPQSQAGTRSRLIQFYMQLRDVLVRFLDIMRPFGGSRSSSQFVPIDQADEFLEFD